MNPTFGSPTNRMVTAAVVFCLTMASSEPQKAQQPQTSVSSSLAPLTPTDHPPVPRDRSQLWLAPEHSARPSSARTAASVLADAYGRQRKQQFAESLAVLRSPILASSPVHDYGLYLTGLAHLELKRYEEAQRAFQSIVDHNPAGYLAHAAVLKAADVAESRGDSAAATAMLEKIVGAKTVTPDVLLSRLARAIESSQNLQRAADTYLRLYYEFPSSDLATVARARLDGLATQGVRPSMTSDDRYKFDLGRAERLFGGRQYAQARDAFEELRGRAQGDDRDLVGLRLAECDFYLKRYRAARDGTQRYKQSGARKAEASFFFLTATRELGAHEGYVALARELVDEYPDTSWAEETLNNLASHYIIVDDDDAADGVFRELLTKFPTGRRAERAAWKVGWRAYRGRDFAETARVFEKGARDFPRSDYRPAYLYWAARSREQVGEADHAASLYRVIDIDYRNSYYGRLTRHRHPEVVVAKAPLKRDSVGTAALPPTHDLIRELLKAEMYTEAMDEILYAQKVWGTSPALEATLGWTYSRMGDLRRGINTTKRAYPQYLAAGGEELPSDLLRIMFPLDYWDTIEAHARFRNLDPYLVAALIVQESTFDPDIRSSANAIGLMQIVPSTGRLYARKVGIRRFSVSLLENASHNVRLGTTYLADLLKQFDGKEHLALASYNAGEHRIVRWVADRPGMEQEEFIDDIPFPETQNYVKKVLGGAGDYRRLYGGRLPTGKPSTPPVANAGKAGTTKKPASKKAKT